MSETPLWECALCGMPHWTSDSVVWLGPTWENREPYCADECAAAIERELLRGGV